MLHADPLLKAVHTDGHATPPERALHPLVDQRDVLALVEGMLEPHDPDGPPCACRALLFAIASRAGLEALMLVQIAWGRASGARVWRSAHAGAPDAAAMRRMSDAIGGLSRQRPDVARLERAMDVVLEVEGLVPPDARGALDGLLAWLHWARGGGSAAGRLAERSLAALPGRELATLVLSRTNAGVLPEWVFAEGRGR